MNKLHIITPVKDSIDTTIQTIESISKSVVKENYKYTIYNDFSTNESTEKLRELSLKHNFELINLQEFTSHPSPNYLLILQMAQQQAIANGASMLIIESDVVINSDTIQYLLDTKQTVENPGMIAAVTKGIKGEINFPYLYARSFCKDLKNTKKRLSFCCTLLTNPFLQKFDFNELNPDKSWYDVFISHKSVELGFNNYLSTIHKVLHIPHSSRPWKKLKKTNPIKYYWIKITKQPDKI